MSKMYSFRADAIVESYMSDLRSFYPGSSDSVIIRSCLVRCALALPLSSIQQTMADSSGVARRVPTAAAAPKEQ